MSKTQKPFAIRRWLSPDQDDTGFIAASMETDELWPDFELWIHSDGDGSESFYRSFSTGRYAASSIEELDVLIDTLTELRAAIVDEAKRQKTEPVK